MSRSPILTFHSPRSRTDRRRRCCWCGAQGEEVLGRRYDSTPALEGGAVVAMVVFKDPADATRLLEDHPQVFEQVRAGRASPQAAAAT